MLSVLLVAPAWAAPDTDDDPARFVKTSPTKAPLVLRPAAALTATLSCQACGFGADDASKVRELTLTFIGSGSGTLEVYDNDDVSSSKRVFSGPVSNGTVFSFASSAIGQDSFSSKIGLYLNGQKIAELHTSCSDAIGPGTTEQTQEKGQDPNGQADVRVESGADKEGDALCPITPPPGGPGCQECEGGVTRLTLRYDGTDPATIVITADNETYDQGLVSPGDTFTINGTKDDGKFEKNDLKIFIDGQEQPRKIHVSCSKPIGPGAVFGDLTVLEADSRDNGRICPVPPCAECKGGVVELALRYTGPPATVRVVDDNMTIFDQMLATGDVFTLEGSKDDGKFEKNDLKMFVGGTEQTRIHVSCSQPIGPGAVFGDFQVVESVSKDNGPVCPSLTSGCVECGQGEDDAENVSQLTVRYDGPSGVDVDIYNDDKDDAGKLLGSFSNVQNGDLLTFNSSAVGDEKLASNISFWIDGHKDAELHTSCSKPLGPGTAAGAFTVVNGRDKRGRPFRDPNDTGPPTVAYSFTFGPDGVERTADDEIRIDVSDDTGIQQLNLTLTDAANPNATPNLFVIQNTFVPGATSAFIRLGFTNFVDNTIVEVEARDACDACPDFFAPFITNPVLDFDALTVTFSAFDETGLEQVVPFRLSPNLTQVSPALLAGTQAYDIVFDITPPGGSLGVLAADKCNAFVFDDVEQAVAKMQGAPGAAQLFDAIETLPGEFVLEQNYPNPFNPQTAIHFALPVEGRVQLAVYDVLGRQVALLASGAYAAGRHSVTFDASSLPSGTYFYRLDAPSGTRVRQMLLIK